VTDKVSIVRLPTGVPGLDELLGGGLPEFSFNLIAGSPGSGKTTLAHQIMFNLAGPDRKAIFFTGLGEPAVKMLRYQQQFEFFDADKINSSIRFVNLSAEVLTGDFDRVLARIVEEVETNEASLVFVDSFRSAAVAAKRTQGGESELQRFVQQLGMRLTMWQATTFLVGEYLPAESDANPIFTVADGIVWLTQHVYRESMVRKMHVMKMRGQGTVSGLHTFRISAAGLRVFPRAIVAEEVIPTRAARKSPVIEARLSVGVPALDEMLGGGLPAGYSLLVAGPSGSGKTVLATQFLLEGVTRGEAGVVAAFEKTPYQSSRRAMQDLIRGGKVGMIDTRGLDLSIDETLHEMTEMVRRLNAKRVVIDSLSGFELALAPTFREDFRESLYRMVAVLTGMGATILMISELEDRYTDLRFSPYGSAFLTDAIIMQRYLEMQGVLKRAMAVVKLRGSDHSKELRLYEITDDGIVVGAALGEYEGLLTGRPVVSDRDDVDGQSGDPSGRKHRPVTTRRKR
jgi:circadian clock protein KaiC